MCLTIPGKILAINDGVAVVENGGRTAQIDMGLVFDAKVGDWVLYATDRAVKLISEDDAKDIISLLEDHYSPVDVSRLSLEFKRIIVKVRSGESQKSKVKSQKFGSRSAAGLYDNDLTEEEIVYLLNLTGKNNLETLFAEANSLRKERLEDFVCIHGIIEFSNICRNNCLYCGIRKNNQISRYKMSIYEIVECAYKAVTKEGYKLIVLQSGEGATYSDHELIEIIKAIKNKMRVFIFLSVGERSKEFYKKAFKAGATGSLMRFETSNKKLYEEMRPGHELEDRLELIRYQRDLGYYVATGSMIGLPGQTVSDIARDLLMIKKLNIPMISAGPFLPVKGTPLEDETFDAKERIEMFLKFIAIARFMMPEIKIPVTTALETLDPENGRHRGLLAGANALMFNLTPEKYAGRYNIYDNRYREREKVWQKYGLFQGEESWEMIEDKLSIK